MKWPYQAQGSEELALDSAGAGHSSFHFNQYIIFPLVGSRIFVIPLDIYNTYIDLFNSTQHSAFIALRIGNIKGELNHHG